MAYSKRKGSAERLPISLARGEKAWEYFLAVLKGTGDINLARRMTGLANDDLKVQIAKHSQEEVDMAELQGKEQRLKQGLDLLNKAHSVAMICEKPADMLQIANIIAPEVTVYPIERERARAKAEFSQGDNQKQINSALADLAQKLQNALKGEKQE